MKEVDSDGIYYFKKVYKWHHSPHRQHSKLSFVVSGGKTNAVRVANYIRNEGYTLEIVNSDYNGFYYQIEVTVP